MKIKILLTVLIILLFNSTTLEVQAQNLDQMISDLDYLSNRDSILTRNIANVDTPNYIPQDLNQTNYPTNLGLHLTHSGHLQLQQNSKYDITEGQVKEHKPNGNMVNLEHEMAEKDANAAKFHEISNMYNKARNILKSATVSGSR